MPPGHNDQGRSTEAISVYQKKRANHTFTRSDHGIKAKASTSSRLKTGGNRGVLSKPRTKAQDDIQDVSDKPHLRPPSNPQELIFYPAYCHAVSPTWFAWVKLTCRQIHHKLVIRPDYQHSLASDHASSSAWPLVLFHLNHPIQFVQIVGVVVVFEVYFEKFWLFTVDDSSGETVDVFCRKPDKDATSAEDLNDQQKDELKEVKDLSQEVQRIVDIGVVVQVKGYVTEFQRYKRNNASDLLHAKSAVSKQRVESREDSGSPVRQITLSRLAVVKDTTQELSLISARTNYYREVLSKPWKLTQQEQQKLHRRATGEHDRKRKYVDRSKEQDAQKKQEEIKSCQEIAKTYLLEEEKRAREADVVRNAVEGANISRTAGCSSKDTASTQKMSMRDGLTTASKDNCDHGTSESRPVKRAKKRKSKILPNPEIKVVTSASHLQESFSIDDEERSLLLRAAFGH